jgi:hypothetical protein
MINNLKKTLLTIFIAGSFAATAQENESMHSTKTPRYVSEKGYWVIESNVKQPKSAIVYFYNLQQQLVYKEEVTGVRLNINRTKVKMRLKKALEFAIAANEKERKGPKDEKIIAGVFKK